MNDNDENTKRETDRPMHWPKAGMSRATIRSGEDFYNVLSSLFSNRDSQIKTCAAMTGHLYNPSTNRCVHCRAHREPERVT